MSFEIITVETEYISTESMPQYPRKPTEMDAIYNDDKNS